jgi:hypothetical protein
MGRRNAPKRRKESKFEAGEGVPQPWASQPKVEFRAIGVPLYAAGEIDYFAIYVLPEDVWYIFPARTLAGMGSVALSPHRKGHKYERYMENWWLLTRHRFRRGARTVVPPEDNRPSSVDRLSGRKRIEECGH